MGKCWMEKITYTGSMFVKNDLFDLQTGWYYVEELRYGNFASNKHNLVKLSNH